MITSFGGLFNSSDICAIIFLTIKYWPCQFQKLIRLFQNSSLLIGHKSRVMQKQHGIPVTDYLLNHKQNANNRRSFPSIPTEKYTDRCTDSYRYIPEYTAGYTITVNRHYQAVRAGQRSYTQTETYFFPMAGGRITKRQQGGCG